MPLSRQEFTAFIRDFDFRHLFNEMGWNNDHSSEPVVVDGQTFTLKAVAEKSGFKILHCSAAQNGRIPDYSTRKKIEFSTTKLFHEHLIIYSDSRKQEQIWQYIVRHPGKPSKITETRYHVSQKPELLFNRASGIFFNMEDEENITIVDVTRKMADNFLQNNEKVTKQFYDRFKKEHTSFLSFIQGIESKVHKDWYASLMLNRLMFCYFIQKKGFLDKNPSYLKDKLTACMEKEGKDKFYSFYRNFLLILFHKGLNEAAHSKELIIEIGDIPYLNGGLFDEHELEKMYEIDVEDQAFEKIFNFFDDYNWYLDDRPVASGNDINPDVIGYIFEKYINDRADMGAYYTKEDITDYISKNCIVPFLFDEVKLNYPKPFSPDGEIWQMVKSSGNSYFYEAVKHGIKTENIWGDLPEDVQIGFNPEMEQTLVSEATAKEEAHLWQIRQSWNREAPPEIALPTEIWREVINRRKRYDEIRSKIKNGEICEINDFITYNLNIRQYIQDVVETTEDPVFIRHFYKALSQVTILDPTCGSGAFLFAAMNILEPLYEACILRMENFVAEAPKGRYPYFEQALEHIQSPGHPNRQYFIYKSIILNNLYGVDIMNEAVEIAKLRLFLKLVATVDPDYRKPNLGLEPLPDIDFNIRTGNTLIGFATKIELMKGLRWQLNFGGEEEKIEEKCDIVAKAFSRYKSIQLTSEADLGDFKQAKDNLNQRLKELNLELNHLLHQQYKAIPWAKWLETHQPFHWFAEFYEIVHEKGGFDILIGNPPYVVYTATSFEYQIKDFKTITCANLYACTCERSFMLTNNTGRFGMIIPNSSISADKFDPLQKLFIKGKTSWISNFAWRPSKLFDGANMLLAIVLSTNNYKDEIYSSIYHKWYNEYREFLFDNLTFQKATEIFRIGSIPKIPANIFFNINSKLKKVSGKLFVQNYFLNKSTIHKIYYFRAVLYWIKILENEPIFREDGIQTTTGEMKPVFLLDENYKYIFVSILSSTTFFIHYIVWSSCQVINSRDFEFPFDFEKLNEARKSKLSKFGVDLQNDFVNNSTINVRNYSARGRTFTMEKQYFYIKKSKPIIDKIDTVLAEHYGFTEEELDFIINYDIKYRMGKELENGEEE